MRRRAVRRWLMLGVAVALTVATIWMGSARIAGRDEQKEIHAYYRHTWPQLHEQVKSVQGFMAGLVDDTMASAEGAVQSIDSFIVPEIDAILARARLIAPESIDLRALHAAYLQAVEGMRQDALAMRAVFADASLALPEMRRRATEILLGTRERFEQYRAHATEVCARYGIDFR